MMTGLSPQSEPGRIPDGTAHSMNAGGAMSCGSRAAPRKGWGLHIDRAVDAFPLASLRGLLSLRILKPSVNFLHYLRLAFLRG